MSLFWVHSRVRLRAHALVSERVFAELAGNARKPSLSKTWMNFPGTLPAAPNRNLKLPFRFLRMEKFLWCWIQTAVLLPILAILTEIFIRKLRCLLNHFTDEQSVVPFSCSGWIHVLLLR